MSGNVHPKPGAIYLFSVCAGNVIWRGKLVQCCTCSKWVHLNYFSFFCPFLLALCIPRNPDLTYLPLSGFLDSLLCDLIAPTPGLTFSLPIPRMLAAASSFSSGRAYPSLNFLPPLFLRSIPTLIM